MNEKQPIPIDENMSDGLKSAINILNSRNVSLTDNIEINYEDDADEEEDDFNGYVSDSGLDDTEIVDDDDDEIIETEVDTSDLDNMF